jgi:hypothetical protein
MQFPLSMANLALLALVLPSAKHREPASQSVTLGTGCPCAPRDHCAGIVVPASFCRRRLLSRCSSPRPTSGYHKFNQRRLPTVAKARTGLVAEGTGIFLFLLQRLSSPPHSLFAFPFIRPRRGSALCTGLAALMYLEQINNSWLGYALSDLDGWSPAAIVATNWLLPIPISLAPNSNSLPAAPIF